MWTHLFTGLSHTVRAFYLPSSIPSLNLHWRVLLPIKPYGPGLFALGHSAPVRGSPRDCSTFWKPFHFPLQGLPLSTPTIRCVPVRGFSQRLELFSPLDWLSFETIQEKEESHEGNGYLKCALIRALRSTSPWTSHSVTSQKMIAGGSDQSISGLTFL